MGRVAFDFYPTPAWATQYLLKALPFDPLGRVLEPCAGNWDIANQLPNLWVWTNDIDMSRTADSHYDMTLPESWKTIADVWFPPDWVITNPPFNAASTILPLAYSACTKGVIMLLRLTYQEPCQDRAAWLWEHQDKQSIIYLPRRVSFTGDGRTDSAATAWFVWGKEGRLCDPFLYPVVEAKQLSLV